MVIQLLVTNYCFGWNLVMVNSQSYMSYKDKLIVYVNMYDNMYEDMYVNMH